MLQGNREALASPLPGKHTWGSAAGADYFACRASGIEHRQVTDAVDGNIVGACEALVVLGHDEVVVRCADRRERRPLVRA